MALTPIPSILDTAKFEHLALQALYQMASGSSGGTSNVNILGSLPAGSNPIGYVSSPTGFVAGQQTVTASAAPLPSASLTTGIVLTNGASATVYIGGAGVTSATGYALPVGASVGLVIANLSSVYIVGTASSGKLSYIGS